ncbi:MAG: erythromycin biosynthesis sensory transduction protein eryC1 [Candidatus Omnitrophota bacterium]|nr:MAG: erythromycin biosynthesis sensory transduction protein eryC1 [Candidatus Omnitrophota bacterium]
MNKIPFIDLAPQNLRLRDKLLSCVDEVICSGEFILGSQVQAFEKEFAAYCGTKYAVGVSSGTDALFLSLLSVGIGKGDEVICPVYTYIATALSISCTGAKPVFVDISPRTFNLDPSEIKKKISKKTKAIIPVHLYGQPAYMGQILKIAKQNNLKVIEDAAQAHGAVYINDQHNKQIVGAVGDIGCFSFYPTKNLSGCGDGGMITTSRKNIYQKLLILRDQGRKGTNRYLHYLKGYNCRLDSIQAALLRVKLKELDAQNQLRRDKAGLYTKLLKKCQGITLPVQPDYAQSVFHIYAVLVKNRDKIYQELQKLNINTAKIYSCPLHLQPAYKDLGCQKGDFPCAEQVSKKILCLPIYPGLKEENIKFIVENLCKICG